MSRQGLPQTLQEAVDHLLSIWSDEDKARLKAMRKDDLIMLHFGTGMGIRNSFGLWGGNGALLQDCSRAMYGEEGRRVHPDDVSHFILEKCWEVLRGQDN